MFRMYLYLVCGFAISGYSLFLTIGANDLASFFSTGIPSSGQVVRQLGWALVSALLWVSHLPPLVSEIAKRKKVLWLSISVRFVRFAYKLLWLPIAMGPLFLWLYKDENLLVRVGVLSCVLLLALFMHKFSLPYLEQIDPNVRRLSACPGISKHV